MKALATRFDRFVAWEKIHQFCCIPLAAYSQAILDYDH
jgi:hypothetical protein